jgi:hypothetical protein
MGMRAMATERRTERPDKTKVATAQILRHYPIACFRLPHSSST